MVIKKLFMMLIALAVLVPVAHAHCPLCTVAAAVGVGLARTIGLDDSIVGLFLGALIVSSALWFNRWLSKRIKLPLQSLLVVLVSFLSLVIPLYLSGMITNIQVMMSIRESNLLFGLGRLGIDRLFTGIISGTALTYVAFGLSDYIKEKRGRVLWPYQGVSFMIIALLVASAAFWMALR